MIVFELSMPNKGSWNGKWSQEGQLFIRTRRECDVPKKYWNDSFCYHWDDGWTACVTVTRMSVNEARKLERKSKGFCGYDWMIQSIIKHGAIGTEREWAETITEQFCEDIDEQPTIEPERKRGKWIEHNPHKWGLGIVFECSECGEKIDCEPSNFCPNCGADMRGEDDG